MLPCVDVPRRDVTQPFMVASVVIVLHEGSDSFLEFTWHIVGLDGYLTLEAAVVPFNLTVGLRMEG